jgi:radical SAM superfamily enzyme YgiQ (UPF0313 family)
VVYPNTYAVGMSSLAVHALWRLLSRAGWTVERAFLNPDPGRGLEHGTRLRDFHLLAFTCAYELDYLHVPRLLEAGGVPPLREQRGPQDPLVIAGGPGVTQNPEPLAPLFDLLFIGEIEPGWEQLQAALAPAAESKQTALEAAAEVPGVYRPGRPPTEPIPRQVLREVDLFPTASLAVTPEAELGDMFLVEVGRGCPQACRFCLARQIYHPFRPRSLESLLATIRPALPVTPRVGLLGAALSDHPDLLPLCEALVQEGAQISTSSLRVSTLTPRLAQILAAGGARTLTLAPETGNEALRRKIGKPLAQEQILAAAQAAQEAGIATLKLYFLVALPEETEEDRQAIAELVAEVRRAAPRLWLEVALSPLVPKPHTPWESLPMPPVAEIRRRCAQVRRALGRQGLAVTVGSARGALAQVALSRGGQELGPVLAQASRAGGDFAALRAACRQAGLRLEAYAEPPADRPWRVVRMDGCAIGREGRA